MMNYSWILLLYTQMRRRREEKKNTTLTYSRKRRRNKKILKIIIKKKKTTQEEEEGNKKIKTEGSDLRGIIDKRTSRPLSSSSFNFQIHRESSRKSRCFYPRCMGLCSSAPPPDPSEVHAQLEAWCATVRLQFNAIMPVLILYNKGGDIYIDGIFHKIFATSSAS